MALLTLFISPLNSQIFPDPDAHKKIVQTTNITNQIIEENEVYTIMLSNYFTGSLLNYYLNIENIDGNVSADIYYMITLSNPWRYLHQSYIDPDCFKEDEAMPFPRSTIMIQETQDYVPYINIYFLSKLYNFTRYDSTRYSQGENQIVYGYQLNTTLLNDVCSDLQRLKYWYHDVLILFCRSYQFDEWGSRYEYETMVIIEQYNTSEPVFRYISYNFSEAALDKRLPIQYLGQELIHLYNYSLLFLCHSGVPFSFNRRPHIVRLNISSYHEMIANNMTYKYTKEGPIFSKYYFSFKSELEDYKIGDYQILNYGYYETWIVFLLTNKGLVFCRITVNIFVSDAHNLNYQCDDTNSYFMAYEGITALYLNQLDPTYLFASMLQPPGVLELDISNPQNAYVNNIYQVKDEKRKFMSLSYLSTNQKFIIHLMQNLFTKEYFMRVYTRQSSYFNIGRFDILLASESQTNFFTFPHYWLNIIWYRDEHTINIMTFDDNKIVFNGTDTSLIQKYNQRIFEANLTIMNDYYTKSIKFNFTFVDKYNTEIYSKSSSWGGQVSIVNDIFYNCGDNGFLYAINEHFNGPNYYLKAMGNSTTEEEESSCDDGSCYFKMTDNRFEKRFDAATDFKNCTHTIIMEYITEGEYAHQRMVMICIDTDNSVVSSWTFCMISWTLWKTNEILLEGMRIAGYSYDEKKRSMFIVTKQPESDQPPLTALEMEVHFLIVQNELIWKNYTQPTGVVRTNDVLYLDFNPSNGYGVLLSDIKDGQQLLSIFLITINPNQTVFQDVLNVNLSVTEQNRTIKAWITKYGFIYLLSKSNTMAVYEFKNDTSETGYKFNKMWQMDFNPLEVIHDFDIIEEKYLVLYKGINEILIYEIYMQIYLIYKMTLPLYEEFENFTFGILAADSQPNSNSQATFKGDSYNNQIKRSITRDFLAVLLISDNYYGEVNYRIFVYCFKGTQHDAFVMTQDMTYFFGESQIMKFFLLYDMESYMISFMNDTKMETFQVRINSFLMLNNNTLDKLHQNCSQLKYETNEQGLIIDKGGCIANILIRPVSMFTNSSAHNNIIGNSTDGVIKLNVFTQNEGLIPTTTFGKSQTSLVYQNDKKTTGNYTQFVIIEELLEGYNLTYDIYCTYYDDYGQIQSCDELGVQKNLYNEMYMFFLEFVTSQNAVFKSFTLDKYFFMFDTQANLNILSLKKYQNDLDEINAMPLVWNTTFKQQHLLGCEVNKFIDIISYLETKTDNTFIMLFQCYISNTLYLKVAQIKIYKDKDPQQQFGEDHGYIKVFDDQLKIANNILDIEVVKVQLTHGRQPKLTGQLAITSEKLTGYSNILYLYNITIDMVLSKVVFTQTGLLSAMVNNRDTFKVEMIENIPGSDLILVGLQGIGAVIIDTQENLLLVEFNIYQLEHFREQNQQQLGPLQVFSVVGDWPYSFHILTNYGLYIFYFKANLTERNEVYPDYKQALTPINMRCFQIYFDTFSYQVAKNAFGYAFLVTKNTSAFNYDVYLGVVSFNSMQNSKILKMIKIVSNQQCISLNQEPLLVSDNKDQIAVSFVCSTQFFVVRLCLKPHFEIDLSLFNHTATKRSNFLNRFLPGVLQYNEFNISIIGANEYTVDEIGKSQVIVNVEVASAFSAFELNMIVFYFGMIFLFVIALFAIFFINRKPHAAPDDDHKDSQRSHRLFSLNRQSTSNKTDSNKTTTLEPSYIQKVALNHTSTGISKTPDESESASVLIPRGHNFGLDLQQLLNQERERKTEFKKSQYRKQQTNQLMQKRLIKKKLSSSMIKADKNDIYNIRSHHNNEQQLMDENWTQSQITSQQSETGGAFDIFRKSRTFYKRS